MAGVVVVLLGHAKGTGHQRFKACSVGVGSNRDTR